MERPWWCFNPFIQGDLNLSSFPHRPSICVDPNWYQCISKTYLYLTFFKALCLFKLKTALRISIVWSGRVSLGDGCFELLGLVRGWSLQDTQLLMHTSQMLSESRKINRTNRKRRKHHGERIAVPDVLSFHTGLWRVSISPHPKMYGRGSKALLYAFPLLIVNSVNEVNLINFRAGSHMTFSSIFSPTSKTSISSSKIGRSEWQSTITQTYLKLRVNLFSGFWMCSLQFSKKTSK